MKKIEELIQNIEKYKDSIIQHEYISKKNTVAYVTMDGKPRVLKWFVPGFKKQMNLESKILEEGSKKLNMPSIYETDQENNVIIMNFIQGENLCDIINSENTDLKEKKRLINMLADWFVDFHNYFKKDNQFRIRGDASLRNFVFRDKIWGVDFEETRLGNPAEDIAAMCASILTTDPMFTKEKFELCSLFIKSYTDKSPARILKINDEISYALLEKIQWRPNDEETLRIYSKQIKEKGLEYSYLQNTRKNY